MAYEKAYVRKRRVDDRLRRGAVPGVLFPLKIHHYRAGGNADPGRRCVAPVLMGGESR